VIYVDTLGSIIHATEGLTMLAAGVERGFLTPGRHSPGTPGRVHAARAGQRVA